MQKFAKKLVVLVLGWQVRRLSKRNSFKVVAVAGSIGKTSTKMAIVEVLKTNFRVQSQEGNYNDIVSVPLIFFNEPLPSLFNPLAWLKLFWRNEKQIKETYPYDVVVIEVSTDGPGQVKKFKSYLQDCLGVLTAITPEHMEFFADLDAVAKEELMLADITQKIIFNKDLCDSKYIKQLSQEVISYSTKGSADIRLTDLKFDGFESSFSIQRGGKVLFQATHESIAEPLLYGATAAVVVALELGMETSDIKKGLANIKPFAGRMNLLKGINNSTIIDDTYNASPVATKAALDTLYRVNAPQKIAILGNMNELGNYSKQAHTEVGGYCDPKQLALVLTIGPDANKYLAPAAEAQGCQVKTFESPYDAGQYLKPLIEKDALILAKGSQNGVFAEETVKLLLADSKDASKLVRQSEEWLKVKARQFPG